MNEIVSGRILHIDEEERIIYVKHKRRIRAFYMQRSLFNNMEKYLCVNRFIQFNASTQSRMFRGNKIFDVEFIMKIMEIRYRKNIVYYDLKNIKKGTKKLLNNLSTKMFLDLEMSMHPYKVDKTFKQEIIQVGYIIVDKDNTIIKQYDQIIKPTIHPKITRRTQKFLKITQEEVDKGIPYIEFYEEFKRDIETYDPAIIVWGRNDFLALRDSYRFNHVKTLKPKTRFINLLKLHKNYFNLKNDLGLFNAHGLYSSQQDDQLHNALEDAIVTMEIFNGFKKVLNKNMYVDISKYK